MAAEVLAQKQETLRIDPRRYLDDIIGCLRIGMEAANAAFPLPSSCDTEAEKTRTAYDIWFRCDATDLSSGIAFLAAKAAATDPDGDINEIPAHEYLNICYEAIRVGAESAMKMRTSDIPYHVVEDALACQLQSMAGEPGPAGRWLEIARLMEAALDEHSKAELTASVLERSFRCS